MAGAVAAGLWLLDRRLGAVATLSALVMAFARVYIAAHYPHDVLVGLAFGAAVALVGWETSVFLGGVLAATLRLSLTAVLLIVVVAAIMGHRGLTGGFVGTTTAALSIIAVSAAAAPAWRTGRRCRGVSCHSDRLNRSTSTRRRARG